MKRRLLFSLLLFCLVGLSIAEEDVLQQARQGEAYYAAGELERSRALFEGLLTGSLTAPQEASIESNIASILFAEGRYEEAVSGYEGIDLGDNPPPHRVRWIDTYKAMALLQWGLEQGEALAEAEEEQFDPAYQKAKHTLERSIVAVASAAKADEELALIERRPQEGDPADLPEDLHAIALAARLALVGMLEEKQERWLKRVTAAKALPRMRRDGDTLIEHLNKIDAVALSTEEQKQYTAALVEAAARQQPLWDKILEGYKEDNSEDRESREGRAQLFSDAYNRRRTALDYLAEGSLEGGRRALAEGRGPLVVVEAMENKEDPIALLLDRRILLLERIPHNSYQQHEERVLKELAVALCKGIQVEDPLTKAMISNLAETIKKREGVAAAREERAFYQQIIEEEAETFVALLEAIDSGERFLPQLKAVQRKLKVRKDIGEEGERLERVAAAIEDAVVTERPESKNKRNKVRGYIERSLMVWDPSRYVLYTVEELLQQYVKSDEKRLNEEAIGVLLEKIQETVVKVEEALRDADSKKRVLTPLIAVLNDTLYSKNRSHEGKDRQAALYFDDAVQWLKRVIRGYDKNKKPAKGILKLALEEENYAVKINEEMHTLFLDNSYESGLIDALRQTQKIVLKELDPFASAVEEAQQAPAEGGEPVPWDEVVALVEEGQEAADSAQWLLASVPPQALDASQQQSKAVAAWREALKLMEDPSDSENDDNDENGNESQEEQQEEQQDDQATMSTLPQQVLQMYQEMEQEDAPDDSGTRSMIKQGLRPW